ncbi:MAG: hypothetical protein LUD15_00555 [Bacteroides sp.]|nr:hypothetical protein [Bacteroides sp.]
MNPYSGFFIGMLAIVLLNRLVARLAYLPFSEVTRQVNSISTHDLNVHIQSPGTKDELHELVDTFNHLLSKYQTHGSFRKTL